MRLQSNGYLIPGECLTNVDEVFNFFVNSARFINSRKRIKHFQKFLTFLKELNSLDFIDGITHLVIDGSFCSSKAEPKDIDIFLYYDAASKKHLDLERYIDSNRLTIKNKGIHIVTFIDFSNVPDTEMDFNKKRLDDLSKRQFERYYKVSRDNIEKGFLKIKKEKLLLGGEQYVSEVIERTQSNTR